MISSNLQEKIREYGESLHVSQRGAFISASQYPKWKKKLFIFLLTKGKGVRRCETLQELLDAVHKVDSSTQSSISKNLKKLLFAPISIPLISIFVAPFLADLIKRQITWQSTPMKEIIAATALGALLD
jgi:hypothetical protein